MVPRYENRSEPYPRARQSTIDLLHIWPYTQIIKGKARHIYLGDEQELILDAIGAAMGKRRIGFEASRSQLIKKAVSNFIEDCMAEVDLNEAIGEIRKHPVISKETTHGR